MSEENELHSVVQRYSHNLTLMGKAGTPDEFIDAGNSEFPLAYDLKSYHLAGKHLFDIIKDIHTLFSHVFQCFQQNYSKRG